MVALRNLEVMHNELKTKIYEAVQSATEEGKHLTEAELAISLGEATVSRSNQARLSVAFINSMDTMTSKRWLKLETTPASKRSRSKRVVVLGPEPMPELGADERMLGGPPVTAYRDESVIDRGRPWASRKRRERTEELVEIVPIKLPDSLQPPAPAPASIPIPDPAPVHVPAAAKEIVRPEPTISIAPKSYEGTPRERAIAAWHDLIDGDGTFSRSHFCALANLSTGGKGKWKALNEKVDGAIWVMGRNGWPYELRQKYRDLVETFLDEWDANHVKVASPSEPEVEPEATAEVEPIVADEVELVEKTETPVADIAPAPTAQEPLNVVEALQQEVDRMGHDIALVMQQIEHHNQEIVHLSQWAAELAEKKSVLVGAIEVLS